MFDATTCALIGRSKRLYHPPRLLIRWHRMHTSFSVPWAVFRNVTGYPWWSVTIQDRFSPDEIHRPSYLQVWNSHESVLKGLITIKWLISSTFRARFEHISAARAFQIVLNGSIITISVCAGQRWNLVKCDRRSRVRSHISSNCGRIWKNDMRVVKLGHSCLNVPYINLPIEIKNTYYGHLNKIMLPQKWLYLFLTLIS